MVKVNPITAIPKHIDFNIPLYFPDDNKKSYLSQLTTRFDQITSFLTSCDERYFEPSIKLDIVERIINIQRSIIEVHTTYLDGFPSKAFLLFKSMLETNNLKQDISALQQYKIPKNTCLFRTQGQWGNIKSKYSEKSGFLNYKDVADMFHPPFQRRRAVGTNRFSISGYPCLYLSENLLTSYSECFPDDNKSANLFNALIFKNLRPLYFIDLSNKKLNQDPKLFGGILSKGKHQEDVSSILDHLGVYQLIIASHTKIQYRPTYKGEKYFFKAEYVIPQLLLQWLKEEGYAIDGIRYRSCTGSKKFPSNLSHYNYVLPVKSNANRGFCPSLGSIFLPSEIYNHYSTVIPKNIKYLLNDVSKKLVASQFKPSKSIIFK